MSKRTQELVKLLPESEEYYRELYFHKFENYATYMRNGIYQWMGLYSNDTRELWLMGVLSLEGIEFEKY